MTSFAQHVRKYAASVECPVVVEKQDLCMLSVSMPESLGRRLTGKHLNLAMFAVVIALDSDSAELDLGPVPRDVRRFLKFWFRRSKRWRWN